MKTKSLRARKMAAARARKASSMTNTGKGSYSAVLLLFTPALAAGSSLWLRNEGGKVQFGESGASLTASCSARLPQVVSMNFSQFTGGASAFTVVRAVFLHMPTTCVYSAIDEPCATPSTDASRAELFYCVWRSELHTRTTGPHAPQVRSESEGVRQAFIDCPTLTQPQILLLTAGVGGADGRAVVGLSIVHFAPMRENATMAADGVLIEYSGLFGGNMTRLLVEPPQHSCVDYRTKGYTVDGMYIIQPDRSVAPFEVFCDMSTDGGGWIVLTTNKGERNYWSYSYSSDNNVDKCGYDGQSTQTNGQYVHSDFYVDKGGCSWTDNITYYTGGTLAATATEGGAVLTADQLAAIRARASTLSSTSKLFAGSCDDDNVERSHEVKAIDAAGNRHYLTNGAGGNEQWYMATYDSTTTLAIGWLLPTSINFHDEYAPSTACSNGGGIIAGWNTPRILIK